MEYLHDLWNAVGAFARTSAMPWDGSLVLLHLLAQMVSAIAALLVPMGLIYLRGRRRDLEYGGLITLFALAILAAGVAHALAGLDLWAPDPLRTGIANAVAAALALSAAGALWRALPNVPRSPSPSQLRRINAALSRDAFEQQQALKSCTEQAQRFREAFSRAGGLAMVGPGERWAEINEQFAALVGQSATEIAAQPPSLLLGEGFAAKAASRTYERKSGGDIRHLAFSWQPLPGAGWLVSCADATGERQRLLAAERLREERSAFEAQVAEQKDLLGDTSVRLEHELRKRHTALVQVKTLAQKVAHIGAQLSDLDRRAAALARVDPSTGLRTPHVFIERLGDAVALARRRDLPLTLLVLAPDPSDELTPAAATAALAKALRPRLRDTDTAAALDDLHLALMLPHAAPTQALAAAERLRKTVAESTIEKDIRLTCCIGVAAWQPDQTPEHLVGHAAEALRRARGGGRNRIAHGWAQEATR